MNGGVDFRKKPFCHNAFGDFLKNVKNFLKAIDKEGFVWYNDCRNKEKFRFHPAARVSKVNKIRPYILMKYSESVFCAGLVLCSAFFCAS